MKIILIVGPSGSGKDSLLRRGVSHLAGHPDVHFIQRYVTRRPDDHETNFYIDQEAFNLLQCNGFFFTSWSAHGNSYGIGHHQLELPSTACALISVSRDVVPHFEDHFLHVKTILITARPEILSSRLHGRNRESSTEIQTRLQRASHTVNATELYYFDNSDPLEKTVPVFLNLLEHLIEGDDQKNRAKSSHAMAAGHLVFAGTNRHVS